MADRNPSVEEEIFISKLSLVDLAGSERGTTLVANNQRIVEGTKINQSLLVFFGSGIIPHKAFPVIQPLRTTSPGY